MNPNMPDEAAEWKRLIMAAPAPPVVIAHTVLGRVNTHAKPGIFECDDGNVYYVKGPQVGRSLYADQVVARIGIVLGAPVAIPAIVGVPAELIAISGDKFADFHPGLGHATRQIENCRDGLFEYGAVPENRSRFLALAVLYGLCDASDHQFLYASRSPHLVHSVDHGHFFPGAVTWTASSLRSAHPAHPDVQIARHVGASPDEALAYCAGLLTLTQDDVAGAVAAPHSSWGVAPSERAEIAAFLWRRRKELLTRAGLSE